MRSAIHNLKRNRKAIVLGKSANHRIRLDMQSRRRCVVGSQLTVNQQTTSKENPMTQNVRISTGFRSLTNQQLATVAAAVITGMTGNKAFPNPPVDLTAVQTALDEYLAALAATVQGGITATATKNNKRDVLTDLLEKLAHYVQTHCGNDREVLLSSGFPPTRLRVSSTTSEKPSIIGVENNGSRTTLVVKAAATGRARCFELRSAAMDPGGTTGPWQQRGLFTNSRSMPVDGLTPGTNYVFQVRAVNTAGLTDWSDPVAHIC
jgi:hypothetical protein